MSLPQIPYAQFLENKVLDVSPRGFNIDLDLLHKSTKPHQRDTIQWAAKGGQRAGFLGFGLGKTLIQLTLARGVADLALIVCPLCVIHEFQEEADRIGIAFSVVMNDADALTAEHPIHVTTYESVRDGKLIVERYVFVSLDEASILRTDNSKTHHTFIELFKNTPLKYVFTATPSPNDFIELIYYAAFLGIMDKSQCKTRFFQRDSTKADKLTLLPHKEREFWLWVSSWACFITKPSDLGYSDEGYDLPELEVKYHRLSIAGTEIKTNQNGELVAFQNKAKGLKGSADEKRLSMEARTAKALNLVTGTDDHFVIWHHLEAERKLLDKALQGEDYVSVYGSQSPEVKSDRLLSFARGECRLLGTKPSIAGSGSNFQKHCHQAIYLGIDHKFNDFIQAIHRIQRFGQLHKVIIHIIYTANEDDILKDLLRKWQQYKDELRIMRAILKKYGLTQNPNSEMKRSIGVTRKEHKGQLFTCINNDCVLELQNMATNSIHLISSSIPFGNMYEYSDKYNDLGHTDNAVHFFEHMDYLTPELLRVLQDGRICAIHVKDRIIPGNVSGLGFATLYDFHCDVIKHFKKHGFHLMSQITIETDVVRENNQTYRLGWKENRKDGTKMGAGVPEYLLIFRKAPSNNVNSYADVPVTKTKEEYPLGRWQIDARAKWNSDGDRLLLPDEIARLKTEDLDKTFADRIRKRPYNYQEHVNVTLQVGDANKLPTKFETMRVPARYDYVWGDIVRIKTLNSQQAQKRQMNHLCPLQFDIYERLIFRFSNEGEKVLDMFGGIGSLGYCAIPMGRESIMIELNEEYHQYAIDYCKAREYKQTVPTLFDSLPELV